MNFAGKAVYYHREFILNAGSINREYKKPVQAASAGLPVTCHEI